MQICGNFARFVMYILQKSCLNGQIFVKKNRTTQR